MGNEKQRIRERKTKWFAENGPCQECGSWEDLEVDHVDRLTKEFPIMWTYSMEKLLPELEKCQALCKTCHREKTSKELQDLYPPREHGMSVMYERWGCRCNVCKEAGTIRRRRYRVNRSKVI